MPRKRRRKNPAKFDRCVREVKRRARGAVNPYAVCTAAGTRKANRRRRRNPPPPRHVKFVIVAAKRGESDLYYAGGERFGARSSAKKFDTKKDAEALAWVIRHAYPRALVGMHVRARQA